MEQGITYSDKELFSAIAEGDEQAFAEVFFRYTAKLFPFVRNMINSESWAEEVVQDVFLRLWQGRENLVHVENPSAYIYRIASNRALDYIKTNARDIKLQYYIAARNTPKAFNVTEADMDFKRAETLLKEAVENLPPKRKEVYLLAQEQGIHQEEIAKKLGISPHTVRNHIAEAMLEIRTYLREKGGFTALVLMIVKNIF